MLLLAYSEFNIGGELIDHLRRNKCYYLDCQVNYTIDKNGLPSPCCALVTNFKPFPPLPKCFSFLNIPEIQRGLEPANLHSGHCKSYSNASIYHHILLIYSLLSQIIKKHVKTIRNIHSAGFASCANLSSHFKWTLGILFKFGSFQNRLFCVCV
jgi:hypothetical protein